MKQWVVLGMLLLLVVLSCHQESDHTIQKQEDNYSQKKIHRHQLPNNLGRGGTETEAMSTEGDEVE
jgi:hypothetical protein